MSPKCSEDLWLNRFKWHYLRLLGSLHECVHVCVRVCAHVHEHTCACVCTRVCACVWYALTYVGVWSERKTFGVLLYHSLPNPLRQVLKELDCGRQASAILLPPPPTAQAGGAGQNLHSDPSVCTAGALIYGTFFPAQVVGDFGDGFHVRSIWH